MFDMIRETLDLLAISHGIFLFWSFFTSNATLCSTIGKLNSNLKEQCKRQWRLHYSQIENSVSAIFNILQENDLKFCFSVF